MTYCFNDLCLFSSLNTCKQFVTAVTVSYCCQLCIALYLFHLSVMYFIFLPFISALCFIDLPVMYFIYLTVMLFIHFPVMYFNPLPVMYFIPLPVTFFVLLSVTFLNLLPVTLFSFSFQSHISFISGILQGVTIPSQRRYVKYYGELIKHDKNYSKTTLFLTGVKFNSIPNLNSGSCSKYIQQALTRDHSSGRFGRSSLPNDP